MTETQERFLQAIAARVPVERVAELHLFPSLRQGQLESGVAVVAVELEGAAAESAPPGPDAGAPHRAGDGPPAVAGDHLAHPAAEPAGVPSAEPADDERCDPTDAAAGPPPDAAEPIEASAGPGEPGDGASAAGSPRVPGGRRAAHGAEARPRLTIYTAHYRLTIKGPDRGKWEIGVSADADAPLVTLEAVVRGVRHRAGDGADTERFSGDEFRAALAATGASGWPTPR
jgi:hypothetical protein